jgi:hypothetical protein
MRVSIFLHTSKWQMGTQIRFEIISSLLPLLVAPGWTDDDPQRLNMILC